jgi:hypothetical protein
MQVAVLTYPGHFFITRLCIESIQQHYPEVTQIHVLYDDSATGVWTSYADDCRAYYPGNLQFHSYGSVDPNIALCPVGWWRQQLVKLCIDKLLSGPEWFVVDGDVIFDEQVDIYRVTPVHNRELETSPLSIMVTRYVDYMLGHTSSRVKVNNQYTITSSIPFRWLDRAGLTHIRQLAEAQMHKDFVLGHNELFAKEEIVGYDESASKMVFHEWELFEGYNNIFRRSDYKIVETGSGYHTIADTSKCIPGHRFRHSSLLDAEVGSEWLTSQGLSISPEHWAKSAEWSEILQRIGR